MSVAFGLGTAVAQETGAVPPSVPAPADAPASAPDPMTLLAGSSSCFQSPLALAPEAVSAFRGAPESLLQPYPDGGIRLALDVRRMAGTDVHTVPMLINLVSKASPGQTSAIGAGLAQAAKICVRQRPDIAQIIQQMIVRANLGALTTAFLSSSGDFATAATGAAGGGGAAAGAGAIGGSPGDGGGSASSGGGVESSGAVPFSRSRRSRPLSIGGGGGSSVTVNIALGGGSVSPVR